MYPPGTHEIPSADEHHARARDALADFWAYLNAPTPPPPELPRQRLRIAHIEALLAIDSRLRELLATDPFGASRASGGKLEA
jgi:hypothetical protein